MTAILCASQATAGTTVGTLAGHFAADPSGAATYSIQVDLPPGARGLAPSLSLNYNSRAGQSLLGIGWSLSGLSAISRCQQTLNTNGISSAPQLAATDQFCLDGEPLIVTNGAVYGAANSVYHTEIDGFQQVSVSSMATGPNNCGLGSGPAVFSVVDRSGLTRTYGNTADGTVTGNGYSYEVSGGGQVYCPDPTRVVWPITQIADQYGHFVTFQYYNLQQQNGAASAASYYIKEIDYGYTLSGTQSNIARVVFNYNDTGLVWNNFIQYLVGTVTKETPALLSGIQVLDGSGNLLRSYNLGYNTGGIPGQPGAPAVLPAQLASVQECGSDGSCFAPTTFQYQGAPFGFSASPTLVMNSTMPNRRSLDLDGDGLTDYIYTDGSSNEVYVVFGDKLNATPIDTGYSANPGNGQYDYGHTVVASVRGDGTQQLLVPFAPQGGSVIWKMLAWNGSKTSPNIIISDPPVVGGGALPALNPGYFSAIGVDLTGAGYTSLVFCYSNTLQFYLNNGSFGSSPVNSQIGCSGNPKMYQVNYSGTGAAEIYVSFVGVVQAQVKANARGTQPTVTGLSLIAQPFDDSHEDALMFFDADGSGLTSAVWVDNSADPADNQWVVYQNTGHGWPTPSPANPNYDYTTFDTSGAGVAQALDWYGDGRQEVVFPSGGWWYALYAANGAASVTPLNLAVTGDPGSAFFQDVDGDGQPDLLYTSGGSTYYIQNSASPYLLDQITNGLGHNINVGYVTLTLAGYTSFVPGASSPVVNVPRIIPYVGPLSLVRDFAIDTGEFSSGTPVQFYTYYKYGGAAMDRWGSGFLGFSEVESINYNTGMFSIDQYSQGFPNIGTMTEEDQYWNSTVGSPQPVVVKTWSGGLKIQCFINKQTGEPDCTIPTYTTSYEPSQFDNGSPISKKTTTTGSLQPYSGVGVYYPYISKNVTQYYELSGSSPFKSVESDFNYQIVGTGTSIGTDIMPTSTAVTTTNLNNANDVATVTTTTSFGAPAEQTCPGFPTQIVAQASYPLNTSYPATTESFTYDSGCNTTSDVKTIVAPSNANLTAQQIYPMTWEKDYSYTGTNPTSGATITNSKGIAISVTLKASGAASSTVWTDLDLTQRFPIVKTNALKQSEIASYDIWGNKLTDMDPNGDLVTYAYDGFERISSQTGPEPAVTESWSYGPCTANCVTGAAYAVTETDSDGKTATTQFDEMQRKVRVIKVGFGNTTIFQDTAYDLLSRVSASSKPYTNVSTSCWDFNTYDPLNRVTERDQATTQGLCAGPGTNNDDRKAVVGYSGFTTTTTESTTNNTGVGSETNTTLLNALGKPAQVTDSNGNSNGYSYDSWGNVISITTPNKSQVLATYDSMNNKLSVQDPDMGSWSYSYDALGETLTQTDSKGQQTVDYFDLLGRRVRRQEPEGTSNWVYDIGYGAGIGRLAYKIGDTGIWEGYAYDAYGNQTDKITVANGQEYWVSNTFDGQGRISQVVYPTLNGINVSGTPSAPTGLAVIQGPPAEWIHVSWTDAAQGEIYHLYRTLQGASSPAAGDQIYSGPYSSFTDTGIIANGTYTWWLQACNDTTCSSPFTTASLAITLPPSVPQMPSVVPPTDTHQQTITVSWPLANMVDPTSPGPIQYKVLQSTDGVNFSRVYWWTGASGQPTPVSGTLSVPITLPGDGTYYFQVRSLTNNDYDSAPSSASAPYTTYMLPTAPTGSTGTVNETPNDNPATFNVGWTGSSFVPTSGITYVVQQATQTTKINALGKQVNVLSPFTQVGTVTVPGTTAANAAANLGVSESADGIYVFQVEACNAGTPAPLSVCSAFVRTGTYAVTLPPVGLTAPFVPSSDWHSPTWSIGWNPTAALPSGSSGTISYYLVQYWSGAGGYTNVPGPPTLVSGQDWLTATAVSQGGYYQNGTYTYALEACNTDPATGGTACTPFMSSASGYPTVIAPGAPTNLQVPAQSNWDGSFTVYYGAPAANTGGPVTDYKLQVYDTACTDPPNAKCIIVPKANCVPSPPTATSCTFAANSLPAGNNGYGLQIKASDNGWSSPWVQGSVPTIWYLSPPAAPQFPSGSFSTSGAYTVNWTTPATTTYFNLYRSVGAGSYSLVQSSAATSYNSSIGLRSAGQNYYVIACNQAGCGSASGVITVTSSGVGTGCPPKNPCQFAPSDDYMTSTTPLPEAGRYTDNVDPASPHADRSAVPAASVMPTAVPERAVAVAPVTINPVSIADLPFIKSVAISVDAVALAPMPEPQLAAYPDGRPAMAVSPRVADMLAHLAPNTKPKEHARRVAAVRTVGPALADNDSEEVQWPPKSIDPILSLYPPLRPDPRIAEHFESMGGSMPGKFQRAASSEPTPTALMIQYQYSDPHGYLTSVVKLNSSGVAVGQLWVPNHVTPYGVVDQATYDAPVGGGSGTLQINDTYDLASGYLIGTQVTAGVANQTLSTSYAWDGYGNLSGRSLTQNGQSAFSETSTYDALNRLSSVATSAGGNTSNSTSKYDPEGSFTSNGGYGNYQYVNPGYSVNGYTYTQPHALASVTLPTGVTRAFQYDMDGNLYGVSENGTATRSVTWFSFNKPTQIQNLSTGSTETFVYDADHDRISDTLTTGSSTDTTTYIDGLFEAEVNSQTQLTTYRHYIVVGGSRIAVDTITANTQGQVQTDQLGFFVHDEVGSVIAQVTENLGGGSQQVAIYSYDAWGKQRSTATTQTQVAYQSLPPDQFMAGLSGQQEGFAGHENLVAIGLVEMEGRIYDPEIGRFLSPDPSVQFPLSTQGFNRYAYVDDNPLSLSDPSGYCAVFGGGVCADAFGGEISNGGSYLWDSFASPSKQFRLTNPIVGNQVNDMFNRSATLRRDVGYVVLVVSAFFNSEWVYGLYEAYITDLEGGSRLQDAFAYIGGWMEAHSLSTGKVDDYWGVAKNVAYAYTKEVVVHETENIAERNGMSLAEVDGYLLALSFIGDAILPSRISSGNLMMQAKDIVDTGTNRVWIVGFGHRGTFGLIFDVVDTLLEYQGIPSATGWQYIFEDRGMPIEAGHSLGSLTANNLVFWGAAPSANLYALPFFNVAAGGTTVSINPGDMVAGFGLGYLFNPEANNPGFVWFGHDADTVYHVDMPSTY